MGRPSCFTDAFLLRAVDYGESDRIVTLLTRHEGKVSALAKGARNSRRRFAGALQPYCRIHAELVPTRGELFRLQQASVVASHVGILSDLGKIGFAGAGLELVREVTAAREADARLFDTVDLFLSSLSAGPGSEALLLAFEARALALSGLTPVIDTCVATGARAPEGQSAYFDPRRGGIVSRAAGGGPILLSGATRMRLRAALGARWQDGLDWSDQEVAEARSALGAFTEHQLGKRLAGRGVVSQIAETRRR